MPTYSYRCTSCGNAFDIQQSFADDSLTVCEACGGPLRKLFSAVGVTFNGSGFYRTDSRSGSSAVPASKSSSGDSSKGSSSGGSSSGSTGGSSSGSSSGGSTASVA
ncbi:putative regulatory protein, FmdB family [Agromyces sp. CF514]|uniref:FmdB family zinc ribbon protein n=1 Tax=Agromyces sp. CF514 TaxID=1881031 RepID=UPI0008EEC3C3|nr:FmdB family zinc ribbon protein [Agromyces sp. CF514]SFR73161.1 putative regulatory protein, FmdB family [Agromyces sp. CF514]